MSDPRQPATPDRNPTFDAAWAAYSTELPPARVDSAILAAAHREVHARPAVVSADDALGKARRPSQVWWGLAAAATLGAIAFGVVQMAPAPLPPETETLVSDLPLATDASPQATLPEPQPRQEPEARAPVRPTEPRNSGATARRDTSLQKPLKPSAQPALATPRAFPDEPTRAQKGAEALERTLVEPDRGDIPAPTKETPAASAPADALVRAPLPAPVGALRREDQAQSAETRKSRTAAATTLLSPDAWVARIVTLLNAGLREDAARELRAFRDAYPNADSQLPTSLHDWAATVKRE